MLVLSRLTNQVIDIGDELRVTVIAIRGDRIRLGFSAPANYQVYRGNLYEKIMEGLAAGIPVPEPRRKESSSGMLALAFIQDEKTYIVKDGNWREPYAVIQIMDIRGDRARIGTNAARSVRIDRQEITQLRTRS